MVLADAIALDAVHRVLRGHYEKGDRWAVQTPVRTGDNVGWSWRFTPAEVRVDASGVLYVEREVECEITNIPRCCTVLYLAPGQWRATVRL